MNGPDTWTLMFRSHVIATLLDILGENAKPSDEPLTYGDLGRMLIEAEDNLKAALELGVEAAPNLPVISTGP